MGSTGPRGIDGAPLRQRRNLDPGRVAIRAVYPKYNQRIQPHQPNVSSTEQMALRRFEGCRGSQRRAREVSGRAAARSRSLRSRMA
jgi:hypothetical protein